MQDPDQGGFASHPARVGAEPAQALGPGPEQQVIDDFLVTASQATQWGRQGEGHQVIGTGQELGALFFQPSLGLLAMTLGAVPIAAGVIAILERTAVLAAIDLTTQRRSAALQDGLERPFLAG
jgi:hypothetical protein